MFQIISGLSTEHHIKYAKILLLYDICTLSGEMLINNNRLKKNLTCYFKKKLQLAVLLQSTE